MIIHSAEFKIGATRGEDVPRDGKPQIAFAGRSNVGKSSLINMLLARKALARTSNTPGRTRQINFFLINDAFWFVDLPGFGYAKVSKTERESWRRLIESYLQIAETLRAIVMLLDARHPPQPNDFQLLEFLLALEVPFIPVLTKADKCKQGEIARRMKELARDAPILAACEPIATSVETKLGRDALWQRIEAYLT